MSRRKQLRPFKVQDDDDDDDSNTKQAKSADNGISPMPNSDNIETARTQPLSKFFQPFDCC